MSLKKKILTLGAAAATLIAGVTSVNAPGNTDTQTTAKEASNKTANNSNQQQAPNNQQAQVQQKVKIHPTGRFGGYVTRDGVSPKEWGQYLQRTGKQKWIKSKRA